MQLPDEVVTDLRKRLTRAGGQVQAVETMLAEGQECRDIVTQLSAATKALEQVGFRLIAGGPGNPGGSASPGGATLTWRGDDVRNADASSASTACKIDQFGRLMVVTAKMMETVQREQRRQTSPFNGTRGGWRCIPR